MSYSLIDSKKLSYVGSGAFGEYSRIKRTNLGLKVHREEFATESEARKSIVFKHVNKELNRLSKVRKLTTLVPKPGTMAILKKKDPSSGNITYIVGYTMEHIKGSNANESYLSEKQRLALDKARSYLKSKGITQIDAHGGNVIITTNKRRRFVFIDAGGFSFTKRQRHSCEWGA